MNPRSTWNWLMVAVALAAFIFFFERHWQKPDTSLKALLPEFSAKAVTSIQVRPAGHLEIRAERTNDAWWLTRPVSYPALNTAVENLLNVFERLGPAGYISTRELRQRPKFDEEYGFTAPQLSLTIQQGDVHSQILFGIRTAPGDQVFVQVVGSEGVYVVDADLLKLIPRMAEQWCDTAMVDPRGQAFDRLIITNGVKTIELVCNGAGGDWTMIRPILARADGKRITESLQKLQSLQAIQFVTSDPKADLEGFGLQPPELSLTLVRGTNVVAQAQFGKSPTNAADLTYARRDQLVSVATVSNLWLTPWFAPVNEFRDHQVLNFTPPVSRIEVHGENNFALLHEGTNTWKVESEDFPVDAELAKKFVHDLAAMRIAQFKDAVTESDLPAFGLTNPVRQIVVQMGRSEPTNPAPIVLSFGAIQDDKIYVRRADEDSVYVVPVEDFLKLPTIGWQLRERRLWNFTENDVQRIVVRQDGKTRELLHHGTNAWSVAAGSQGVINEAAIEEVAHRMGELAATLWDARANTNAALYGLDTNGLSYQFELKNGQQPRVQFGGMAPSGYPYAAMDLDGQQWVFEFPLALYHFALMYLSLTADTP